MKSRRRRWSGSWAYRRRRNSSSSNPAPLFEPDSPCPELYRRRSWCVGISGAACAASSHSHSAFLCCASSSSVAQCVSIGKDGAALFSGEQVTRCSSLAVEAVDTVGAGDAFLGAFVQAMRIGLPYADCLRRGCVAGSLACGARLQQVSVVVEEAEAAAAAAAAAAAGGAPP